MVVSGGRELSVMKINWKNAHVSLRSFLIHTTLQKRTPTTRRRDFERRDDSLEEGCQNASLFSRISLFLCLLLLL